MFQSSRPSRFTAGYTGTGAIKMKPHSVDGLVYTKEIQDIRTPKGVTKWCHIDTSTFAFQSIFPKAFWRKRLCDLAVPVSKQKHWRSAAKSVCIHLANWVLIVTKLWSCFRVVEAGRDTNPRGRAIPAPGMESHIFQLKAGMQKNPKGNTCCHSWVQHLKSFISKHTFH